MEPLANKIRPKSLDTFVGQTDLVGMGKPLRVAIEEKHLFSFILWGPPGTGKTTLARMYAKALSAEYHELSAVSAGKDDIRKIIDAGGLFGPKILFLDEIHRFNKAQQDFLLPFVETGQLTLIGATTENPSFEVNPALLSRMRVFVLKELSEKDLEEIISRTGLAITDAAKRELARIANGDARSMLSIIDSTQRLYGEITRETLEKAAIDRRLRFDKNGEEHYNTISAFIKSMRASQPDAALHYLSRMVEAGEDPKFIARRMVIFASEDIGMRDPHALLVANAVFRAVEIIGMPEAGINLSHGVVYLSNAPKSKAAYYAYNEALADVRKEGNLPIPLKIRNAPTTLMKDLEYGKGYEKYDTNDLLPEKLKGTKYFRPEEYDEGA
ncbi:MAG: rarA [Parcubacteria group bacterium]|nr:rarA [Parcubacteria group bacterium]